MFALGELATVFPSFLVPVSPMHTGEEKEMRLCGIANLVGMLVNQVKDYVESQVAARRLRLSARSLENGKDQMLRIAKNAVFRGRDASKFPFGSCMIQNTAEVSMSKANTPTAIT